MARTIQEPENHAHNIRVYDSDGALLASIHVRPDLSLYITHSMLYQYCSFAVLIPSQEEWGIYSLLDTGSPSYLMRDGRETVVKPGNYVILNQLGKNPIAVQLNPECPPQRVPTRDRDSELESQEPSESGGINLQRVILTNPPTRDEGCTITQKDTNIGGVYNHCLIKAGHIIPTSQIDVWNKDYKGHITESCPSQIGESIYSPRNGLTLGLNEHILFDRYMIGIDPMADYKVIFFGNDSNGWGGRRLKDSAIHGANNIPGVHPSFLQWHLRMCLLANMKADSGPRSPWEVDLGKDDMGQILEQHDANERMETELFTRLGEYVV